MAKRPDINANGEHRASALWGRGGRERRRSTCVLAALVVCLLVPTAGLADGGLDAAVPAELLAAARADPNATFDVVVQGEKGRSSGDISGRVANEKAKLKRAFRSIAGVSATVTGAQLLRLAEDSHVAVITRDHRVRTTYVDAEMWRESVGATRLWAAEGSAPPQAPAIAIVDTGIDATKAADFGSRVVARANFSSLEPAASGDPSGHGTMVAGVAAGAAAASRGVAPNAPLVDVRVASSEGEALTTDILAGVDWILANRERYNIRVANFSLGGDYAASFRYDPLDRAVERLWLSGIVVVASVGNHGTNNEVPIGAPANDPFVITVGALDVNGTVTRADDTRANWSAYGHTADGFLKPELAAPGRFMVMPVPNGAYIPSRKQNRVVSSGYMWMSGTSFAAPVVSGAAAQLLARRPELTPDQVKGALMATAGGLGEAGTGVGEVDVAAAAAASAAPNPNEGLHAFVSDGSFDAEAWASHVSTTSNWTLSNWTASNWTASNWTLSNWTASNWTQSNWTASNWTQSNWVE
jgi:serine protease AprX